MWTFFITNFKLLKDMGFQNNVDLVGNVGHCTLEGFSNFDGCSSMYKTWIHAMKFMNEFVVNFKHFKLNYNKKFII